MTIEELKEEKLVLERQIYHLIRNFENKTDVAVTKVKYHTIEKVVGNDFITVSIDI